MKTLLQARSFSTQLLGPVSIANRLFHLRQPQLGIVDIPLKLYHGDSVGHLSAVWIHQGVVSVLPALVFQAVSHLPPIVHKTVVIMIAVGVYPLAGAAGVRQVAL